MAPTLINAPTSLADQQWFFSPKDLTRPPSVRVERGAITLERERYLRRKVVKKLWELQTGIRGPTLVVATASIFMHRFYMRETMQDFDALVVTAASYFLASKVEEAPRSLRSILGATLEADRRKGRIYTNPATDKPNPPNENDGQYLEFRRKVLHCEETMLRVLCFDLTIRLPYPAALKAIQRLWKTNEEMAHRVKGVAWGFVNDSLPSILALIHRPNVIAAAAIVCACSQLEIPLPADPVPPAAELSESEKLALELLKREQATEEGEEVEDEPYWLELMDVKVEELQDAVKRMMESYRLARDEFVVQESRKLAPKANEAASRVLPTPVRLPPPPAPDAATTEPTPSAASAAPPPAPPILTSAGDESPLLITIAPHPAPPPPAPAPPVPERTTTTEQDFASLFDSPLHPPPPPPPPPAPFPQPTEQPLPAVEVKMEAMAEAQDEPKIEAKQEVSANPLSSLSFKRTAPVAELGDEGQQPEEKKVKLEGEA